jgi:hypothetical protein
LRGGTPEDQIFKIQDVIAKTPYAGISPEVIEKTDEVHVSGEKSDVRSQNRLALTARSFCLLAPVSFLLHSKIKVHPEMLMKTKEAVLRGPQ